MSCNACPAIESGADTLPTQHKKEDAALAVEVAAADQDCVRLSFDEIAALSDLLDDLYDVHTEMIQMLEQFAATMGIFARGAPMAREADSLHELAIASAAKASEVFDASERLAELQQILLERQLDDLLRALEGSQTDPRGVAEPAETSEVRV